MGWFPLGLGRLRSWGNLSWTTFLCRDMSWTTQLRRILQTMRLVFAREDLEHDVKHCAVDVDCPGQAASLYDWRGKQSGEQVNWNCVCSWKPCQADADTNPTFQLELQASRRCESRCTTRRVPNHNKFVEGLRKQQRAIRHGSVALPECGSA